MNILDAEDMIKGLPDQTLMQQAQMPTGELPQFLVISEIQRRSDMRKRHEAQMQEQSQGTVKDQIMREGIAAMMPQQPMGMPPQMMPQGMPPQGMPPQGMPTGMPPMGMAAGGVVQMQRGGFLDQYVAGAEAGPMPGGSTVRDQIDRLLASGMSYPEILSFVSKTFYGRPEVLEYVQSKVGRPQASMGDSMIPEAREALEREPYESKEARMPMLAGGSDIYKAPMVLRAADALGLFDSFKEKPEQERMAEPMASALVRDLEAQYATPDLSQRLTAEAQLDALDGMPVTPEDRSFKGITLSETRPKPQVKPASEIYAGSSLKRGIEALGGAISGELSATPLAQFDREASQRIREVMEKDGIGAAIGQFGREAVASVMPAARTVVEGGIAPILGAVGEGVGYVADTPIISEQARALDQLITGSVDDPLTLGQIFGSKDATKQGRSPVQTQGNGMLSGYTDYTTLLPAVAADEVAAQFPFSPEFLQRENAIAAAREKARNEDFSTFAGEDIYRTAGAGTETTKGERTPQTRLTDAVAELPRNDRSDPDMPALDFSDLIAESKQQALANAMIQLGAGVASGDVAKGLSAAGTAAMRGTADARALDMKRRLAEYQAGREDIRRGEEAERFERQMTLQERKVDISEDQFDRTLAQAGEKIKADIDKGVRVSKGQLLNYIADVLKESGRDLIPQEGQTRQDMLTALQNQLLSQFGPFLDVDVSELVASGAGAAGAIPFDTLLQQR